MNQNKLKVAVTAVITLMLSLYLGIGAASAQGEVLKVTGVAMMIAILVGFGRRVWLLVPLTMLSSLSFRWMPGQWRAADLAYLIVIGGCTLLFLTRNLKFKIQWRPIHIFGLLVIASVVQAYARHPVGLNVLGSSNVGGRAYFTFAVGLMMCVLFSVLSVPVKDLFAMRKYALVGGVFTLVAQWLAYVPGLALPLALGLGTGNLDFNSQGTSGGAAGRNMAGADSAKILSRITVAYTNPLKSLLFNRWTLIVCFAILGGLVSGFRSQLGGGILILAIGVFYWQGIRAVIAAFLVGVFGLMSLAILNLMLPLSPEAQRSLSFLPGTWEQRYVREGEDSNDWRFEMWEEALTSERWIKNKIMGDGLGFSSKELDLQSAMQQGDYGMAGFGTLSAQQVSLLINGDYHSGPVSFVRAVGYVGLGIFALGLLAVLISSHRLLRSLKGTPYFGIAALICIPAFAQPFIFFFVFGTFSGDISQFFLNVGMICFLRNNIDFENLHRDPREEPMEESEVSAKALS